MDDTEDFIPEAESYQHRFTDGSLITIAENFPVVEIPHPRITKYDAEVVEHLMEQHQWSGAKTIEYIKANYR